ncbi:MAG: hypothetical protein AB8F74_15500 [Saprospiraceae bacterium]
MKTSNFYKYTTWGLLLLNLALLSFFLLSKPNHPHKKGGKKGAPEILKMDQEQSDLFLSYAEKHIKLMDKLDTEQRDLLKEYFGTLTDVQAVSNTSQSTINQILQIEQRKIESTYEHFKEIKLILKPEQQGNYEKFVKRTLRHLLFNQQRPPPPEKK